MDRDIRYIGCYFDMLGQSDRYLLLNDSKVSEEQVNSILSESSETMAVVNHMKEVVATIADNAEAVFAQLKSYPGSIFANLSLKDFTAARPNWWDDFGVLPFSDGAFLYVKEGILWSGVIFFTWLTRLAELMVSLHAKHISVRGAISIGKASVVRGGSICGPLVDEVDVIEKRTAFYSRIVVSHLFEEYIRGLLAKRETGAAIDTTFLAAGDLFAADIDGVLMLDYLSTHMVDALRREGRTSSYFDSYRKASSIVNGFAESWMDKVSSGAVALEKSSIAWKYRFLDTYYGASEQLLIACQRPCPGEYSSELRLQRYPLKEKLGVYIVAYFKIDKLISIPEVYDEEFNYEHSFDIAPSGDDTACLLGSIISQFNLLTDEWTKHPERIYRSSLVSKDVWRDKDIFCANAEGLSVGIEHIGKYVLFYVRKDTPIAILYLISCLQMISRMTLEALLRNHVLSSACCIGKGWEMSQDQLMGPCIGIAHRLADRLAFYPRMCLSPEMCLSPDLEREISHSKSCKTFFEGNGGYPVLKDVDGIYFWDYLSDINQFLFGVRNPQVDWLGAIEFVYTGICKRMAYFGHCARRKEIHAGKVRPLLLLQFYLEDKLRRGGVDCAAIKEKIIQDVAK